MLTLVALLVSGLCAVVISKYDPEDPLTPFWVHGVANVMFFSFVLFMIGMLVHIVTSPLTGKTLNWVVDHI
jgi:hypothetical protein